MVMLVEDLHWADDSSLAWFDAADHVLHDRPVLVIATARPALLERHPHWGEGLDFHDRLDVRSLSRRESRLLVDEILQKVDELPRSLRELVVTAADGNPFHIEELVKWLLDAGVIIKDGATWQVRDQTVDQARVPPTLRGVLQARLDALSPPERATLQRAAVVGRVFWDAAVDSLAARVRGGRGPGGQSTAKALEQMRAREVVYERPHSAFDETREFFFKHTLLRDVTYDSVLKAHRLSYHGLVARWLEQAAERSRRLDQYAGLIAGHYDRAGDDTAAARWYLRAGHQATGVDAMQRGHRSARPRAGTGARHRSRVAVRSPPGTRSGVRAIRRTRPAAGRRWPSWNGWNPVSTIPAGRSSSCCARGTGRSTPATSRPRSPPPGRPSIGAAPPASTSSRSRPSSCAARDWRGTASTRAANEVLEEALAGARATGQALAHRRVDPLHGDRRRQPG